VTIALLALLSVALLAALSLLGTAVVLLRRDIRELRRAIQRWAPPREHFPR
jgi:hypothetical protein